MDTIANTSRLYGERGHLSCRKTSHKLASCSRAFYGSGFPAKHPRHIQKDSSRTALTIQAAQASVAYQSVDDSVWDERYTEQGPLQYGLATLQGPRGEMEDYASIVPRGRCGFLYAGCFACLAHQLVSVNMFAVEPCIDTFVVATAVFDGHGGHSAADYMSKNFYKLLSVSIDDETHDSGSKAASKGFACALVQLPRCCTQAQAHLALVSCTMSKAL